MGFFTNLGFIYYATGMNEVVEKVSDKAIGSVRDSFSNAETKCAEWSDERLIREARTTTSVTHKIAYVRELQNRGYTTGDLQ